MMRAVWLVAMLGAVLFGGMTGCGEEPVICASENSRAALRNLSQPSIWWDVDRFDSETTLQYVEQRIAVTRSWAETLSDYCERRAYLKWMDHWTESVVEARKDRAEDERMEKVAEEKTKPPKMTKPPAF